MGRLVAIFTIFILIFGTSTSFAINERIVNGQNTTIEEYPYQLSLESIPLNGMHFCGASLLRANVALTAAHCTNTFQPSDFRIRAGTTTRESGGVTANVISICQHPKFTPNTIDADVSVLVLDRDLPIGPTIQTIALQQQNHEVPVGSVGTVTGWGALHWQGPSPVVLQKLNLAKTTQDECANTFPDVNVNNNMICFKSIEGGTDACSRDSGGPIAVNGVQVGVVSFGPKCNGKSEPNVFAKVSSIDVSNHINRCLANV